LEATETTSKAITRSVQEGASPVPETADSPPCEEAEEDNPPQTRPRDPRQRKPGIRTKAKNVGKREVPQLDLFTAFIKEKEAEQDAKRGALFDRQEDHRKKLQQVHRTTELMLQLDDDTELKDKKYTTDGHKVMMATMTNDNRCRSDSVLVREARKFGDAPEVCQLRKLYKQLYIKPPTPPTAAPVAKKPVVDDSLAGMFKKPVPGASADPDADLF
jgi:hypothetical protein